MQLRSLCAIPIFVWLWARITSKTRSDLRYSHSPRSRRIVSDGSGWSLMTLLLVEPFWDGIVTLAICVLGIGIINGRIFAVLSVVFGFVRAGDAVAGQGRRWNVDPGTGRFETASRCSVLDLSNATGIVHETIFSMYLTVRIFRFNFIRAIGCFVTVTVATVLVMPVRSIKR